MHILYLPYCSQRLVVGEIWAFCCCYDQHYVLSEKCIQINSPPPPVFQDLVHLAALESPISLMRVLLTPPLSLPTESCVEGLTLLQLAAVQGQKDMVGQRQRAEWCELAAGGRDGVRLSLMLGSTQTPFVNFILFGSTQTLCLIIIIIIMQHWRS